MKAEPRPGVVNLSQPISIEPVDAPKVGDHWESPSGLGFRVTAVTKKAVTVSVDRSVRNKLEVRTRDVPITGWDSFARPYTRLP